MENAQFVLLHKCVFLKICLKIYVKYVRESHDYNYYNNAQTLVDRW